jgi:hypothetical protein
LIAGIDMLTAADQAIVEMVVGARSRPGAA